MKRPWRIACTGCPTRLQCSAGSRAEFAAALEERGWRVLAKGTGRAQAVCPQCAKKLKPEELVQPKHAGATP